jgi:hypothetical protein
MRTLSATLYVETSAKRGYQEDCIDIAPSKAKKGLRAIHPNVPDYNPPDETV